MGNGFVSYYVLKDFKGKIGFISVLGYCFCEMCNWIWIIVDGYLKMCLYFVDGYLLKEVLVME